jgi:hypothetical protein
MSKRPFTFRPNKSVQKGIELVVTLLLVERESGYEKVFPDITNGSLIHLEDALNWLEQYVSDDFEERYGLYED